MLEGKNILLGVTGSIAAYKAAILVRTFVRQGASVRVIMTQSAKQFITPLTLSTLSKNPIYVEFFNPENGEWNSHVSLGEWADVYVIAPATANTISKAASGVADNLLLTSYLSSRCPVVMAPAMDLDMYAHPATQRSMEILRKDGVVFVEPDEGELASGLVGKGRMASPEDIADTVDALLDCSERTMAGKKFLVTAGPTKEAIDPVRYITNHSTGKMGYAIAGELARRGADVTLVSGPTSLPVPRGVRRVDVVSAADMYEAVMADFLSCDGAVMCAAVADYTPLSVSPVKIKKTDGDTPMSVPLKRTQDIAAALGRCKDGRILVGFALETDNENSNARKKLLSKNMDFIVLNSMRDSDACFGTDTNKVTIISPDSEEACPLESKAAVACRIADRIEDILTRR